MDGNVLLTARVVYIEDTFISEKTVSLWTFKRYSTKISKLVFIKTKHKQTNKQKHCI